MTKSSSFRTAALTLALLLSVLVAPAMPAGAQPPPLPPVAASEEGNEEPAATEPTFDNPTSTVTVPEVAGLEFLIDGELAAPGPKIFEIPYKGKDVTVTARGLDGAPNPSPAEWKHLFPEVVAMPAPEFKDDTLQVRAPSRSGVRLYVDGWGDGAPLKAGSLNDLSQFAGQTFTVRAVAVSPTTLIFSGPTEWTHTFPGAIVPPTWDDLASTVTIPTVAGVEYLIDGDLAVPGPHTFAVPYRGKEVKITARGANGAPIPAPQTWTHVSPRW